MQGGGDIVGSTADGRGRARVGAPNRASSRGWLGMRGRGCPNNGLGCRWVCREGWSACAGCRVLTAWRSCRCPDLVRPTAMAFLPAGRVEYRLDRRGDAVVVVFHGGHVRAGLAVGEEVFAAAGCTILAPSRPGYGRTPLSTGHIGGGVHRRGPGAVCPVGRHAGRRRRRHLRWRTDRRHDGRAACRPRRARDPGQCRGMAAVSGSLDPPRRAPQVRHRHRAPDLGGDACARARGAPMPACG